MHHHYSNDKFVPDCSFDYFAGLVKACASDSLPLAENETVEAFVSRLRKIVFDPAYESKMVNLTEGVARSEESRVGKECVSTGRARGLTFHSKKKQSHLQ